MAAVNKDLQQQLDLPVAEGALITDAVEGGPAADAGLRGGTDASGAPTADGDVIVAVDGQKVSDPDAVAAAVTGKQPGDKVEVEVYRGDKTETITVTLGERPEQLEGSSENEQPQAPEGDDGDGLFP